MLLFDLVIDNYPLDVPCRIQDPELWFSPVPERLAQAKTFCQDCPVRSDCLSGAMERDEPWGVWGGEIFHWGVIVERKRPRGRPRKEERGGVAA
jgi:WhiB family redox-sensing transcriptional regulator